MNILLTGARLRRLFAWRKETLILAGQLGGVDTPFDSPEAGNRPANDSAAAQLGDIARKLSADRRRRAEIAGTGDLFGEPAWDILLGLFIAGCEGRRLSVATACSGAGAPESTALRWITILEKRGMIVREGAPEHAFLKLSASINASLADYLAQV
ncbi:MAG: regulatory protein MarR [Novosphingobium sp.]|nr:regulatory protein MarR [Novosphingobium sp.]